ncbi:bifunctional lysylphosphatidylglycerol synthetase/lysine--tRNA ligase LysX [Salinifilum ghardaiensis]
MNRRPVGTPTEVLQAAQSSWTARVPRVVVAALVVISVLSGLSAVGSVFHGSQPVREFVDEYVFPAPANLGYAAFVLVLAAALARRKRVAYWILLLVLGLQLVLAALAGLVLVLAPAQQLGARLPPWVPWALAGTVLFTAAVLGVLAAASRQFYGRVQRGSVPQALSVFALLVATSVGLGYALVSLFPGSLESPADRLSWTVERALGGAVTFDLTRFGHAPGWVNLVLGLLGMTTMLATLAVMFRAQRTASELHAADERRVRALLDEYGERDSLGYFATRRDKAVLFSPSGKAAISYRVVAGVCLASGDPIGDPEAWPPVIDRWLALCREYTWRPAVLGAGEQGARAYSRAGVKILQLGDEAVVDTAAFTLAGREMRPVRQAVQRLQRDGYAVRCRRHGDVPAADMAEAVRLASAWRSTDAERGFSMALGRLGDPADADCVLVEALDPRGQVRALLSLAPWGRRGLSLDLMRRDREADNGLVELMVCTLIGEASRFGVRRISLNFAVFRSAFEEGARLGAGPVLKIWRGLLQFFSRWWQLESLYRSNAKYHPHWVPRFVGFTDRRDLGRVGLAAGLAEGFVPDLGRTRRRAAVADAPEQRVPQRSEPVAEEEHQRLPEQVRVRRQKLDELRAGGVEPYPVAVPRETSLGELRAQHEGLAADTRTGVRTAIAGRVMLLRDHGGLCFATVRDFTGTLQVMLSTQDTGAESLRSWRRQVDLGDHVSVRGEVITTRHGELSVLAASWTLAAKCLHPLPEKHTGLSDPETRARKRSVDLLSGSAGRQVLSARSATMQALRATLLEQDYLEVDTPILQPVHGGATARPFCTHLNAHNMPMYLRIAPELYLKRLCVGGVERVFELGRTFRNEGISPKHNPEFTMLEAYQAHADYAVMRQVCRQLVLAAASAALGTTVLQQPGPDGQLAKVDLAADWPVVPVHEAVSRAVGEPVTPDTPVRRLRGIAERSGVRCTADAAGELVLELYEQLVERHTTAPVFYTDFPIEVSPLTRQHRADERLAERWDLVAFGTELATAYSELIDPVEQRRRLVEQSRLAAGGDPEAMQLDEDFLDALEYAMPPTGGLGMGVDRLVMLLLGKSIRETLPFPFVRPRRP